MHKVTFFLSIIFFLASANPKPTRIVTKLTHVCSKSVTKNVTSCIKDLSNTHLAYLKSRLGVSSSDFEVDLHAPRHGYFYLATIRIGTPPVMQHVLLDTGNSLLWVRCLPSDTDTFQVDPEQERIFDPSESSTYSKLSCFHPLCLPSIHGRCGIEDICEFNLFYSDKTYAIGELSNETFTFSSSVSIPNLVFGCALVHNEKFEESYGILGLNADKTSLVSQLGCSAYSYCFGDMWATEYEHMKLVIGDSSIIIGKSTPFEIYNSQYYVRLEGISVGRKILKIDPAIFERENARGGVIIDSGSACTHLRSSAFNELKKEVKHLVDKAGLERVQDPELLCYKGSVSDDLVNFPDVTLHFAGGVYFGGANLVLRPVNVFLPIPGEKAFCFAFIMSENKGMDFNLTGMNAQQNYNIGYDLSAGTISFFKIDCEFLFPDE